MAKLTLTDLTSLANDTSAVNTINANNALIETAIDSAVFRTGALPNAMTADLDMGTNYILNVKSPNNGTDGASKAYVDSLLSGTTDTGSAQLRLDLASTANTDGASLVGVEDSAGNFVGTNVETVLAETDDKIDTHITDLASTANAKGASLLGVEDVVAAFTGTTVETVTNEIFDNTRYMQYAYLVASGTDTYTATPSPALSAYTTGETYRVSFANANTSVAPTLNLNALGAKTIKDIAGNALVVGEIDGEHLVSYNGTDMILLNPLVIVTNTPATGFTPTDNIYLADNGYIVTGAQITVDAVSASATWESFGPTGSAADNIWTSMDNVPTDAVAALVRIYSEVVGSTTATDYYTGTILAKGGTGSGAPIAGMVSRPGFTNRSGAAEKASQIVDVWVPLDSSQRFDLYWISVGASATQTIWMTLVGFSK